ncbi:MAG: hypothetical protein ACOCZS_01000 [Verrucomicrobiota bacterium]
MKEQNRKPVLTKLMSSRRISRMRTTLLLSNPIPIPSPTPISELRDKI